MYNGKEIKPGQSYILNADGSFMDISKEIEKLSNIDTDNSKSKPSASLVDVDKRIIEYNCYGNKGKSLVSLLSSHVGYGAYKTICFEKSFKNLNQISGTYTPKDTDMYTAVDADEEFGVNAGDQVCFKYIKDKVYVSDTIKIHQTGILRIYYSSTPAIIFLHKACDTTCCKYFGGTDGALKAIKNNDKEYYPRMINGFDVRQLGICQTIRLYNTPTCGVDPIRYKMLIEVPVEDGDIVKLEGYYWNAGPVEAYI